MFFPFALSSDEPEVFLPKFSQTAILHAAHFRRGAIECTPVKRGNVTQDNTDILYADTENWVWQRVSADRKLNL